MATMSESRVRKVIIIGSGPAGDTAAIYSARADLQPLLFEGLVRGGVPGGALMIANHVENFPGFPEKIEGPALIRAFREQSEAHGVEIVTDDVHRVDLRRSPLSVWAGDDDKRYDARSLIVATGAPAKWLGLESEAALQGRGVSACAVCDGAFFRDQDVVLVGGGDTAMEEATYLTRLCRSVTIVHRRGEFRARRPLRDRVFANPKVRIFYDTVVDEVRDVSLGAVTGARVRNVKTGETCDVACAGVFIAIGHMPNVDLFRGQLELRENGTIKTKPGTTHTSVPGVFACGDVQDLVYRQAVTAAATGCMAARDAEGWIALDAGRLETGVLP